MKGIDRLDSATTTRSTDHEPGRSRSRFSNCLSFELQPVAACATAGTSDARNKVKAACLVRTLGPHRTGRTDVTRPDQPDASEGHVRLSKQPLNDPAQDRFNRARLSQCNGLEHLQVHGGIVHEISWSSTRSRGPRKFVDHRQREIKHLQTRVVRPGVRSGSPRSPGA
jgi:hypothetical protein